MLHVAIYVDLSVESQKSQFSLFSLGRENGSGNWRVGEKGQLAYQHLP